MSTPAQGGAGGARWTSTAAIALLLVAHAVLVFRQYPPSAWRQGEIVVRGDASRYFGTLWASAQVSGGYGYDPYSMAGYPVGLWNSMGKKGFELAHALLPGVALPSLFYGTLVAVSLLAPVLFWLGVRRFVAPGAARIALLAAAWVYWHLDTMTSYFWGYGNVFFPASALLAVVTCGWLWDALRGERPWRCALGVALGVTAIFYVHTVTLVTLAVPFAAAAWLHRARLRRAWLPLAAAAGLAVLLCLPWLVPLARGIADCVPQPRAWLQSSWKHWVMDAFTDRGYRHHFDRRLLLHAAIVFGGAGLAVTWKQRAFACVSGLAAFACLLLVYTGSYVRPLASLQPYRFLIPAVWFLLLPALAAGGWSARQAAACPPAARRAAALLLLVLCPAFTGYLVDLQQRPPSATLLPSQRAVLAAVAAADTPGRVLCDDMHIGHMIPCVLRRPVIGGLSTQAFVRHRFAGTDEEGVVFGRPCGAWTGERFKTYLDTYAVDLLVLKRPEWIAFVRRFPGLFTPRAGAGGMELFTVNDAAPSLALTGEADVQAGFDRIAVRNAAPGRLVLKLHYEPWLAADAGVTLGPVPVLDDPVPFIECTVPAGVTSFTIAKRSAVLPSGSRPRGER